MVNPYVMVGALFAVGLLLLLYFLTKGGASDKPYRRLHGLPACPTWAQISRGGTWTNSFANCPERWKVGYACVVDGPNIEELCEQKGLRRTLPGSKCWRSNVMEDMPDGTRRTMVGVTYAPNKEIALSRIVENPTAEEGEYFRDPGWCEYRSGDGTVWGGIESIRMKRLL